MVSISVVIPAFKAAATLQRAFESIWLDTLPGKECIIVLDGLDEAATKIAVSCSEARVVQSTRNLGPSGARNVGLSATSAKYVMFLDADDWVEGQLLAGLVRAMDARNADIAFGPSVREWPGQRRGRLLAPSAAGTLDIIRQWLEGRFVPPCAVLWRTQFVRSIGGWNEALRRGEDGEIVFRGLLSGARVAVSNEGCGVYVQHGSPDRVSGRLDDDALRSELAIIRYVMNELAQRDALEGILLEAARSALYMWMRTSVRAGQLVMAHEFETAWRNIGGRAHQGSVAHCAVSAVLGLERKERLAAYLRRRVGWGRLRA